MKLQELMDREIKYTIERDTDKTFMVKAVIENREILFSAAVHSAGEESGGHPYVYIEFSELRMSTRADGEIYPRRVYDKTGNGGEMQVLSFISSMIKKTLAKFNPDMIRFGAEKEGSKDNRADLYKKLGTRLFKDYALSVNMSSDGEYSYFTYTKKDHEAK
jgi:hypothetical protein